MGVNCVPVPEAGLGEKKKSLKTTTQQSSFCFSIYISIECCVKVSASTIVIFCCLPVFLTIFYLCLPDLSFLIFFESLFLLRGSLLISETCGLLSVTLFCFVCFALLLLLHVSIHTWPISNFQALLIYLDFINVISNYFIITDFFPKNKFFHLHLVLLPL